MDGKSRAHVIVSGTVQGVCFRSETRDMALGLGVRGWVRNRADGRLEAVFEGGRGSVRRMVEFCSHGPRGASVDSIETEWEAYKGEFSSFTIRY